MHLNFCEIGKMTNEELLQVYCLAPQALENKFTGSDWVDFLGSKPEFAIHCEWHKLDGKDWRRLLMRHPEFAEHCNLNKLSGSDWSELLSVQPNLAQHCDWEKLDGWNWMMLLKSRPEFSEHCDWKKLNVIHWMMLLEFRPEFVKHCDLSELVFISPTILSYLPLELVAKCFRIVPLTRIGWQRIKEREMLQENRYRPVALFFLASWLRSSDNFSPRFKFSFQPIFLLHRKFSKRDRNKYDFPTESPGEFWIQYDIARDLYKKHFQALLTHHKWKMLEKLLQLDAQKFIQVLPFKTLFLPLLFAAPESLIMNVIKAYENNVKKKIAEFHDKRGNNMLHYLFVRLLDECPAWVFNPPEEYRGMEEILIANGADPAEKNLMQLSYLDCMEYFRSALQEQKC